MQLNILFDFLGKSFLPQGEEAARNTDGAGGPAGFGATLAAALGIVSRDASTNSSAEHTRSSDISLVSGDADASRSEGEEATSSLQKEDGGAQTPGRSIDVEASAEPTATATADPAHARIKDPSPASAEPKYSKQDLAPAPRRSAAAMPDQTAPASSGAPAATSSENVSADLAQEIPSESTPAAPASDSYTAPDLENTSSVSTSSAGNAAATPAADVNERPSPGPGKAPERSTPAPAERPAQTPADRPATTPTDRPVATALPSDGPTTDDLEQRGAARPDSRTDSAAGRTSVTTETAPREDSSNAPTRESGFVGRAMSASRSESASADSLRSSTQREASVRENQTAAGRILDPVPHSASLKATDPVDAKTSPVRAADFARVAQQPSEAAPSRGADAPRMAPNGQHPLSGATPAAGEVATTSPKSAPSTDRSDLPAGAERVTVLQDGSSSDETADASPRRPAAPTTSATRNPSTALPNPSANDAVAASSEGEASDVKSASDLDEAAQKAASDAGGGDEPDVAGKRPDEGVRRTDTHRSDADVNRKDASDRLHAASQGDSRFTHDDTGTYSQSRNRQSPSGGGQNGAVGAVSTESQSAMAEAPVDDVVVDTDPSSEESAFTPEQKTTIAGAASTEGVQTSARSRTPGSIAWLRSMLAESTRALNLAQGWKSIEVQLEKGLGTMTVKARRSEDGVSISVTFSDPHLRSLVEANAHRLQDVLRAEYEANVDLSLMSDGSTDTPHERNQPGSGRSSRAGSASSSAPAQDNVDQSAPPHPATAAIRNEWIG